MPRRLPQRRAEQLFLLAAAVEQNKAAAKERTVSALPFRRRRTLRAWLAKPRRAVPARGTWALRSRGRVPRATRALARGGKPWMARRRAQRVQELNNVLQEQHANEAHGCAGGRLHITQIGRARSAEQRTALPALPHRSHRMGAGHPAALAATAAAPNLWRYVERPPIAPRAATTGVMRSLDCRGDAGMGEASASRSALSSGLAEEPVRCRLQRRRR